MYRGWWINTPSEMRHRITIDGEAVVELDYSGFVARSIYHQSGIDYLDDPYDIKELADYAEEQGYPRHHYRKSIKKMLVALLNGDGECSHPEMVRLDLSFKPRFSRPEIELLIERKHPLIAKRFRTGEGMRNQRLDSDIALSIICNLMDVGIVSLPIHDSFIVGKSAISHLMNQMINEYQHRLGFNPVISIE